MKMKTTQCPTCDGEGAVPFVTAIGGPIDVRRRGDSSYRRITNSDAVSLADLDPSDVSRAIGGGRLAHVPATDDPALRAMAIEAQRATPESQEPTS